MAVVLLAANVWIKRITKVGEAVGEGSEDDIHSATTSIQSWNLFI